jgi:hypothetical protein
MGYRNHRTNNDYFASSEYLIDQYKKNMEETAYLKTQESINMLAKIVANENIAIVVKPDAPTAAFDLQNRTLILPTWQNLSKDMGDALRGHEVSHALWTPAEGWHSEVGERAEARGVKFPSLWAACLNVAEDTRIERKLKEFLPGYRAIMSRAYADVYSIILQKEGMDVKAMLDGGALNRVNYVAKVGRQEMGCLRTDAERLILTIMLEAETWEDAVAAAEKLYDICLADAAGEPMNINEITITTVQCEGGEDGEEGEGQGKDGEEGEGQGKDGEGEDGEAKAFSRRKSLENKLNKIGEPLNISMDDFGDRFADPSHETARQPLFVKKKVIPTRSIWG